MVPEKRVIERLFNQPQHSLCFSHLYTALEGGMWWITDGRFVIDTSCLLIRHHGGHLWIIFISLDVSERVCVCVCLSTFAVESCHLERGQTARAQGRNKKLNKYTQFRNWCLLNCISNNPYSFSTKHNFTSLTSCSIAERCIAVKRNLQPEPRRRKDEQSRVRVTLSEGVVPQAWGDVGGSSPSDTCQELSWALNAPWDGKGYLREEVWCSASFPVRELKKKKTVTPKCCQRMMQM